MPYNSQYVELDESGNLRPTQPPGGGLMSGEKTAHPADPSGCRDPSVNNLCNSRPEDDPVEMVSSASCLRRAGRAVLEVGVYWTNGVGIIQEGGQAKGSVFGIFRLSVWIKWEIDLMCV